MRTAAAFAVALYDGSADADKPRLEPRPAHPDDGVVGAVDGEVVRGDPALRRRVLLAGPFVLALGVAALATAPRASRLLILWLQEPGGERYAVLAMLGFATPFTLMAWLVAVEAARRSIQTLQSRRFPPPGMRVMHDTLVVRGRAVYFLGVFGLGLATLLLLAGSVLPVVAYRIGAVLRDGCPRAVPPASVRSNPWRPG